MWNLLRPAPVPPPTERVRFDKWRRQYRAPFAKMNGDKEVRRYFPRTLTAQESNQQVRQWAQAHRKNGFGLYPVLQKTNNTFMGFVGLTRVEFSCDYFQQNEAVEIGWRLATDFWQQGYASEAAQAVCAYAFTRLGLESIVSMTAKANKPSEAVMQRIGMTRLGAFYHPLLPRHDSLCLHLCYQLTKKAWKKL